MGSSGSASRGLTAVSALAVCALLAVSAGQAQAACAPETLDLRGPTGVARFHVEIADTGAERNRGLMFRETLPSAAGMLFAQRHGEQLGRELGIDHTTIEINLDSVKAGLGVELETNSLTYRELQQRRELIQIRMRERVKR